MSSSVLGHTAGLEIRDHKGKSVLALNCGHASDSLEGLRLVKASRGSGWFYRSGHLAPWETKGVLAHEGQLVVWGETAGSLEGLEPTPWPLDGPDAWSLQRTLIDAWTGLAARGELPRRFDPSGVLLARDGEGWALAFVPRDLATVLTSVLPRDIRQTWEEFLYPDEGPSSWPFSSMAFLWRAVEQPLPWSQPDESFLRQEIRDLSKSLGAAELPSGLDEATQALWLASVAKVPSTAEQWAAWSKAHPTPPVVRQRKVDASRARLQARESGQFWRRRGTLVLAVGGLTALVLVIVGSVVWGALKPDPTDNWTPQAVVQGYYDALENLEVTGLDKLTTAEARKGQAVSQDSELTTNLFVLIQVRVSYERQSPRLKAADWVAQGKPELKSGQMLFGLTDLKLVQIGPSDWSATYIRWISTSAPTAGQAAASLGEAQHDLLKLEKTWKGWKVSSLQRSQVPLP
ncbi:MAG: hypothetical protein WCG80_00225 [Spirochaetales bacterium]